MYGDCLINHDFCISLLLCFLEVWTENADGSGVANFLTGQGGFLQSVINGYGRIRMDVHFMTVDCNPVPGTQSLR